MLIHWKSQYFYSKVKEQHIAIYNMHASHRYNVGEKKTDKRVHTGSFISRSRTKLICDDR